MDEFYDDLIAKYFAREIMPDEKATLMAWVEADPAHQAHFAQMQKVWERVPLAPPLPRAVDTEQALQRVKSQINHATSTQMTVKRRKIWPLLAAASVAGLTLIWLFTQPALPQQTQYQTADAVLLDTLPDGSAVTLNRKSGLTAQYSGSARTVNLRGEAFFEVTKDAQKPFIVQVNDLEIKVLGTAFNVDNLTDAQRVVVTVREGTVQVQDAAEKVVLTAGMEAIYDRLARKITVSTQPADLNMIAYKDLQFEFNSTPLASVLRALEKGYNVTIVLQNKSLSTCPLQATFLNKTLAEVLDIVAETYSLKVETSNGGYTLVGGQCE